MLYFDFETTNLDYGSALNPENRIVMVAWAVDDGPVRGFAGDILEARQFWADIGQADSLCAYNAKFEQHWLQRLGVDIHRYEWHDPLLTEYVLLGNLRPGLALGKVAARYGEDTKDPYIDALMQGGVCPSKMPQARLMARCKRDVRTMRSIYRKQLCDLEARGQLGVYQTRTELTPVLTGIEAAGMQLDAERVADAYGEYWQRNTALLAELTQMTGGINLRSPTQLAEFLYEKLKFPERPDRRGKPMRGKPSKRWPDGAPKTDSATLAWLETQATTREQARFIELRREYGKTNAALTKNLEAFQGVCQHRGGVLHGTMNQIVTATHRLSSSGVPIELPGLGRRGVQFQNMPREFKRLFCARPGYRVVEADFSQLEFRVAAFLGDDPQALADIHDPDFDAHVTSASVMNSVPYDELLDRYRSGDPVAKAMRQRAKADTFKPLYGGTKGTPEQERWYSEFRTRYSGIYSTQEGWLAEVLANGGDLVLPWGMRFHWDFTVNSRGVALDARTFKPIGPAVFNYPVQNLATGEIVPIGITALHVACGDSGVDARFVNTVHDSAVAEVREGDEAAFVECVKIAFLQTVYETLWHRYGLEFRVPLGVEITIGTHWGEGETIKYDDVQHGGHLTWQK